MIGHGSFAGREGTRYTAVAAGSTGAAGSTESAELELTECSEPLVSGGYVSFTLSFISARITTQGTYLLTGGGLDGEPVFLVPVASGDGHIQLQAVFTQPATPSEEH
ncbi:hypothetical protein OH146_07050 [Salinibacterium sp. SYSU T00001]|uniref:DUF6916 family protein n=1 Tax=Homoserinimonas sedimenticola TaxID=2986805 RepID=UPI002235F9CA|nr:hypothetical protein [Salinibacterium sedimenticola]MCW4385528.1 hypothetical protein [Salinibacterium sedimenticola]